MDEHRPDETNTLDVALRPRKGSSCVARCCPRVGSLALTTSILSATSGRTRVSRTSSGSTTAGFTSADPSAGTPAGALRRRTEAAPPAPYKHRKTLVSTFRSAPTRSYRRPQAPPLQATRDDQPRTLRHRDRQRRRVEHLQRISLPGRGGSCWPHRRLERIGRVRPRRPLRNDGSTRLLHSWRATGDPRRRSDRTWSLLGVHGRDDYAGLNERPSLQRDSRSSSSTKHEITRCVASISSGSR